jgi:3-oxoacyl-[acyl-carrier-protein] synthase-1
MQKRIFITGYGMISCLGDNTKEALSSMLSGKSGLKPVEMLKSSAHFDVPVGEVPYNIDQLFKLAGIEPVEGYSRNALIGMIAAREAYNHARMDRPCNLKTGFISATTVGGMDQCEIFYDDFLANDSRNAFIDTYDCADSTEKIAIALGISGFVTTISTACSSASNAIMFGARMIRSGKLDRCLTGGCESLTKFHLSGFSALKILDTAPGKPFDRDRAGINLGEGAAYLVLESEESLAITGNEVICELSGWGNSCEAFHQTASSPDGTGPYLAMKKALEMSGLKPGDIDYINAHGTGTDNNDLSEGIAIERLFGNRIPLVSSTKPFTGHTTSAAGSTESILSIFCLQHQLVWPNLNFKEPIEELHFSPVAKLVTNFPVRAVMTNSFGFGGNDTTLIFTKSLTSKS